MFLKNVSCHSLKTANSVTGKSLNLNGKRKSFNHTDILFWYKSLLTIVDT